jgi:hypothetical protein
MRPTYLDSEFELEVDLVSDHLKSIEQRELESWELETLFELEDLVTDVSNAVRLNYYYGSNLGWNQHYDKINSLLLPFAGMKNVSLGPEAFAHALAGWQKSQGFSETDSDGILGPHSWSVMEPLLSKGSYVPYPTLPTSGSGSSAPPVSDILAFNRWHAAKIVDAMSNGLLGTNFDSKTQLTSLAGGQTVLSVNPKTKIVEALPVIYHILENAKSENFKDIIIGSFIRKPTDGKCIGHCEGRCIDINYKVGNFETTGSVRMVANILRYLLTLPSQYKKSIGFGMPLQGQFFGRTALKKFSSVNASLLRDPELRTLVPQLGNVFPDNDNHLHIQVNW